MASTKIMFLGILLMLLGLALNAGATQFVVVRSIGPDATSTFAYVAVILFAVGFIVGVTGFFRH